MKKIFLLSTLVLILVNCKSQLILDDKNYHPTDFEKKIQNELGAILNINFENNFNNDEVKIIVDDNPVFSKKLNTDDILGIAGSYKLEKSFKVILIYINDNKLTLRNSKIKNYKNLYINKLNNNKFEILATNKIHFYK